MNGVELDWKLTQEQRILQLILGGNMKPAQPLSFN
jgi:hypothetical protein